MAFEQGDTLYLVSPVTPITPSQSDIEAYAYGPSIVQDLRKKAPNEHIAWFGGHYVQAGRPNANGAMWLSDELALKALTPMFMPVTVMHDPRTAVGVIADLRLDLESQQPKIENALACWKHRFPEVIEEAEENYAQGSLMQSMECKSPEYECSECSALFHKLPGGAEQELWCDHLKASQPSGGFGDFTPSAPRQEGATAVRILRSVVFTGTGLIFGTQGGVGADPEANLESFQGAVAECHARAHRETYASRSSRSQPVMSETVAKSEFDRVVAEREELKTKLADAEKARDDAKASVEEVEAKLKTAEGERDEAKAKVTTFEETARKSKLAEERFEALGEGFLAKLGDKTKSNLRDDAEAMSDDDWNKRLEVVEELASVKRDAKKDDAEGGDGGDGGKGGGSGDETFSRDDVAASRLGGAATPAGGNNGSGQTASSRRSVVAGLTKSVGK